MSESARDEALRLAREAGCTEVQPNPMGCYLAYEDLERLIALARQRPGWVWVPQEPTQDSCHPQKL
jgi:hypothetical protein